MINPVKILVFFTMLYAVIWLPKKNNRVNQLVIYILFLSFFIEIINSILISLQRSFVLFLSLVTVLYFSLWLYLFKLTDKDLVSRHAGTIIVAYITFCITNIALTESYKYSYYTFVTGAIIYIILFIIRSFYYLKKENLVFFQNNQYLLLFAPVLFFLGMSFMFSFNSSEITSIKILNIKLYKWINYFVNFIFYLLLNWYIHKERKLKNE